MVGAGLSWLRIMYDLVHFLCLGLRSRTSVLRKKHLLGLESLCVANY